MNTEIIGFCLIVIPMGLILWVGAIIGVIFLVNTIRESF